MNKTTLRYTAISALLCMGLLINGCQEVGPYVNLHNNVASATYIETPAQQPEAKNVLIDLFTGVSCSNCPPSHDILNNMIQANGHIIGIEYHPGGSYWGLDHLPPGTKQNMTWSGAPTLFANGALTDPATGPVGAVDRIVQPMSQAIGGPSIWDLSSTWAGYAASELSMAPPVNINLVSAYNAGMKQFNISVVLHYNTMAHADTNRLSIYLTEDSIVTSQLLPNQSIDTNYIHMHVMRAAVTNILGDNITAAIVPGLVDSVGYTYTLSPSDSLWKPAHMNVVALVHKYQNGIYNILQAKLIKAK